MARTGSIVWVSLVLGCSSGGAPTGGSDVDTTPVDSGSRVVDAGPSSPGLASDAGSEEADGDGGGATADAGRGSGGGNPGGEGPIGGAPEASVSCAGATDIEDGLGLVVSDTLPMGADPDCENPAFTYLWTAPSSGVYRMYVTNPSDLPLAILGTGICDGGESAFACRSSGVIVQAGDQVLIGLQPRGAAGGDFDLYIEQGEAACDNEEDDDGDGLTDCADKDCQDIGAEACVELECADEVDDDGDGMIDCRDRDCAMSPGCFEAVCDDEIDDDGDGRTDCEDRDCIEFGACEGEMEG